MANYSNELTYFEVWVLAVALLNGVATVEHGIGYPSWGEALHCVTVWEPVPQYKQWLFFGCVYILFADRFPGVPAERGVTMQAVVETNILKLHGICSWSLYVFQLGYVWVSLQYLQQKVVK